MLSAEVKKIFDAPSLSGAEDVLGAIITDEDSGCITRIHGRFGRGAFRAGDFDAGIDAAALYRRGILNRADNGGDAAPRYTLSDFYTRLDIFVISEGELYASFPEAARAELDAWYFDTYYSRLNITGGKAPTEDRAATLGETLLFIERETREARLVHCDCRALAAARNHCEKPLRTCVTFRSGPNTSADRGIAQRITKDEAKKIIRMADGAGLMHRINSGTICNCCADCCYLSRAEKRRNAELSARQTGFEKWPLQDKRVVFNKNKCVNCEVCVSRCAYNLISVNDGGAININTQHCAGCGLCVNTCPSEALELKEIL